jgi:hypothetical protein
MGSFSEAEKASLRQWASASDREFWISAKGFRDTLAEKYERSENFEEVYLQFQTKVLSMRDHLRRVFQIPITPAMTVASLRSDLPEASKAVIKNFIRVQRRRGWLNPQLPPDVTPEQIAFIEAVSNYSQFELLEKIAPIVRDVHRELETTDPEFATSDIARNTEELAPHHTELGILDDLTEIYQQVMKCALEAGVEIWDVPTENRISDLMYSYFDFIFLRMKYLPDEDPFEFRYLPQAMCDQSDIELLKEVVTKLQFDRFVKEFANRIANSLSRLVRSTRKDASHAGFRANKARLVIGDSISLTEEGVEFAEQCYDKLKTVVRERRFHRARSYVQNNGVIGASYESTVALDKFVRYAAEWIVSHEPWAPMRPPRVTAREREYLEIWSRATDREFYREARGTLEAFAKESKSSSAKDVSKRPQIYTIGLRDLLQDWHYTASPEDEVSLEKVDATTRIALEKFIRNYYARATAPRPTLIPQIPSGFSSTERDALRVVAAMGTDRLHESVSPVVQLMHEEFKADRPNYDRSYIGEVEAQKGFTPIGLLDHFAEHYKHLIVTALA